MSRRFTDPMRKRVYEGFRRAMADLFSDAYYQPKSGVGPPAPKTLGEAAKAYWAGRLDRPCAHAISPPTGFYAAWAAGRDDRVQDLRRGGDERSR